MLGVGASVCPDCGGEPIYYDRVRRMVRTKGGAVEYIFLRRFRCADCGRIHRELTERVLPYKQYDAEIISGVREGLITTDTLGYEDYPCF